MLDMHNIVGSHDIVLITLDTLRYDIANRELAEGNLPVLSRYISHWEKRHAPASFTYPSHHAIFSGFMPTPFNDPHHPRLFALGFPGSATITNSTYVFETEDNIVKGLAQKGYQTLCVGGVGFFNKLTPLGNVLPTMFNHSVWTPSLGVTDVHSTKNQIDIALQMLAKNAANSPAFLFINISAIHQPNCHYHHNCESDNVESHAAALRYVDKMIAPLFNNGKQRRDTLYLIMSDHGTAYGEDGYEGHRLAHEVVWTVPYAEFIVKKNDHA